MADHYGFLRQDLQARLTAAEAELEHQAGEFANERHVWETDLAALEAENERLRTALKAADELAGTYGRVWAKDAKFYTYQDARAALAAAPEEASSDE